jgi:ATP-dependent DNA helicase RecQ
MFQLHSFQREAIEALGSQSHVICVAPTGSGKSLIYEKTAAIQGTRTLLVTPLIALARQQHQRLQATGIDVRLGAGDSKEPPPPLSTKPGAWIVSPETLQFESHQRALKNWKPNFLVVDECHCLWDWGERFRPAFADLPSLIRKHALPRSLWLTATLPQPAREDLRSKLPEPIREIGRFALPASLHLEIARVPWPDRAEALLAWVNQRPEPGIIFVPTRANTAKLANLITTQQRRVLTYHAGMGAEERRATESLIQSETQDIIVATSAFGMGMDHPHLRWVVLWQAPNSLLSLTQSIGRAGRNANAKSHALVMWDDDDFRLLEWTVGSSERRKQEMVSTREYLRAARCREFGLSQYFDTFIQQNRCTRCDFCTSPLIAF